MSFQEVPKNRSWLKKFSCAFRGVLLGVRGQHSFSVHAFFTVAVVGLAILFKVDRLEGCLLVLCIAAVLAAEMFNSALERLAKAIDDKYNQQLGDGLDIASAAVLVMAFGAALVGAMILGYRAAEWFGFLSPSRM